MANQPFDRDDLQFMSEVGIDPNDLTALTKEAPPLSNDTLARIRQSTRAKAGLPVRAAGKKPRRTFWAWAASVALVACVSAGIMLLPSPTSGNVVHAMEQAMQKINSYHGVVEHRRPGATATRTEVWWSGDRYVIQTEHERIVSDGSYAWHELPQQRVAYRALALNTDEVRYADLREQASHASQSKHTIEGAEEIAGRPATRVRLEAPNGVVYYMWIDSETNLPLQIKGPLPDDQWETWTYLSVEVNPKLDDQFFAYTPPQGFRVTHGDSTWIASAEEAKALTGFQPKMPAIAPKRIGVMTPGVVVLDYTDTVVYEMQARETLDTRLVQAIGTAAGGPLAVHFNWLTWIQDGLMIRVDGERRFEIAKEIAPDLKLPDPNQDLISAATVKVTIAENAEVGTGATALLAAQSFVQIEMADAAYQPVSHTGKQAVISVAEGPYARIYVKQVRPAAWVVTGHDPR